MQSVVIKGRRNPRKGLAQSEVTGLRYSTEKVWPYPVPQSELTDKYGNVATDHLPSLILFQIFRDFNQQTVPLKMMCAFIHCC